MNLKKFALAILLSASCMQPALAWSLFMNKILRQNYIAGSLAIASGTLAGELLGTSFITDLLISEVIGLSICLYFFRIPGSQPTGQIITGRFLLQRPHQGS